MELHNIYPLNNSFLVTGIRWPGWPVQQSAFPYVMSIDNNGCWQYSCSNVGIDELSSYNAKAFHLYPNPANSFVTVDYTLPDGNPNASLVIYDITGRIICSSAITDNMGHLTINTQRFNSGLYFCSLQTEGKVLVTGKLVVQ